MRWQIPKLEMLNGGDFVQGGSWGGGCAAGTSVTSGVCNVGWGVSGDCTGGQNPTGTLCNTGYTADGSPFDTCGVGGTAASCSAGNAA